MKPTRPWDSPSQGLFTCSTIATNSTEYNSAGESRFLPEYPRMTRVILTNDQANIVRQSSDRVALCDEAGNFIGYVDSDIGFTPEEIEEAERLAASAGPWYTTEEVLKHLRALAPE